MGNCQPDGANMSHKTRLSPKSYAAGEAALDQLTKKSYH